MSDENMSVDLETANDFPVQIELQCERCDCCDKPSFAMFIHSFTSTYCLMDLTADNLRQMAFTLTAFANRMEEGKEEDHAEV